MIKKKPFGLSVFLEEVLDLVYLHANRKHIAINLEKGENVPANLFSDQQRLQQVLLHLLINAVKYTPQYKTITIRVTVDTLNAHMVVFHVADQGIGIPRDKQIKLFKLFGGTSDLDDLQDKANIKQGNKQISEGVAGFGLTITNLLCGRLGQELTVDSTVNVGTTFTFGVKSDIREPALKKRVPHPFEKARSFRHSHHVFTQKSVRSREEGEEIDVPPLSLALSQRHNETFKPRLNSLEEDEKDIVLTTQEFTAEKDINPVRHFSLNHMAGGFSARGITPKDITTPMSEVQSQEALAKKLHLVRCKKNSDQPLLLHYARGEETPHSVSPHMADFSDQRPTSPKANGLTSVSFLPGKDIAENRNFFRAMVSHDSMKNAASTTSVSQRRVYDQTLAYLNHPCRCPVVLLVDDTEINKIVLSGMLSRLGLLHVEACNGLEALDMLRQHNGSKQCHCAGIKLVLMDCSMPIMNGFEATQEIQQMINRKEITPVAVVAVTAYEGASVEQESKEAGMAELITKPISIERLLQCLHDYLDS